MGRINFFILVVGAAVALIGYRLGQLTVVKHADYVKAAQAQQQSQSAVTIAGRGTIYFADGHSVAAANGPGGSRLYPLNTLAAQTLGFVGYNNNGRAGQYGIEGYYDVELTSGHDLVLTIDKNIQEMAEAKLAAVLKKWNSPSGAIIIEDPQSGAILALAASPSFDPNHYRDYGLKHFTNPAVQAVYEPGSSFKPITMSAAVDSGAVTPDSGYEDSGAVQSGGYTIKNFDEQAHGWQTMRQVLEHSLNTGAIFAEQKTGDDNFLNYVVGFGFGQKSGVDLPGEVGGNIANLYTGYKTNFLTAAFGQGVAVTPIQLVNAYATIANGGKLLQPRLVKRVIAKDGRVTDSRTKIIGQPVKDGTARQLQTMLVDVVDKGFDKARITGYDVAGKTGTAQIPAPGGGYLEHDQFIHNFVGFAPAYDPRFVALIKMDRPKGIKFAADSLSPVFGDIARYLIRYFNIPPSRK